MEKISIDAVYGPELVEFWAHKYQEVKKEVENLKKSVADARADKLSAENAELLGLVRTIRTGADEAATCLQRLHETEKEKADLATRLATAEAERSSLSQQVNLAYAQAAALASEADQCRRNMLAALFPPVTFAEVPPEPASFVFADSGAIVEQLATEYPDERMYFLPRPPACLPLRVPACAQPGYWFFPHRIPQQDTAFHLVVEGRPGEWSYLGHYISAPFPGAEMRLSEWMNIDEQTKMAHCARIASISAGLPADQTPPFPDQLAIKRRYELGEWRVPCFTLRCVGFSNVLYQRLHLAARSESGHMPAPSPRADIPSTLQVQMYSGPRPNARAVSRKRSRQSGAGRDKSNGIAEESESGERKKKKLHTIPYVPKTEPS
ncbi:hypothetical protein BJ138DRAFT_1144601 [Hygrophoropsis aurantiaca]|uniref:Uncharacterized protein n=1 Tax=Hygrophoropsis aurantiaca TaxID=72124 RepID=A0ACB8ANG0_9AGAM|nr:hypothetical protein BJ138DRAFT_1144601 [Hygrophoropsis aurantiaca]